MMTIVARLAEQCPGGVQHHYRCSYYTPAQGYISSDFNEILLVGYPTDEVTASFAK